MTDEILDAWWHRHVDGTCTEYGAAYDTTCPYCESSKTKRSLADLMED